MTGSFTPVTRQQTITLHIVGALVATPYFEEGKTFANAVTGQDKRGAWRNEIAVFSGDAGTGKTTCARWVAQHNARPTAVVTMPPKPNPLDFLRLTTRAITGVMPNKGVTRIAMENNLGQILQQWQGVIIVDEMQEMGADAMRELAFLYEETNHAFAAVCVGTTADETIRNYPQLNSRCLARVRFERLRRKSLLEVVNQLDPRFEATPDHLLADHNETTANGLLRLWAHTIKWADIFGMEGALSAADFAYIASVLDYSE